MDLKIEMLESQLRQGEWVNVNSDLTPVAVRFQVQEGKKAILTLDLIVLDLSDHPSRGYVVKVRGAKAKGTSRRFRGFGR